MAYLQRKGWIFMNNREIKRGDIYYVALPLGIGSEQQGLLHDSLVLLEQIRTIDKARLREYIGNLDNETMNKIDTALAISVGL